MVHTTSSYLINARLFLWAKPGKRGTVWIYLMIWSLPINLFIQTITNTKDQYLWKSDKSKTEISGDPKLTLVTGCLALQSSIFKVS